MPISNKKLLGGLAAFSAITLTTSSVVSCGFNLSRVVNRKVDTSEYKTTFSYAVTNWNTAYTMQSEDQLVLANTNATLLAIDQYGRIYGDIFQSNPDFASQTVGKTTDSISWEYQVRQGLKWKKTDGTTRRDILASDMWNTAYYALYTKKTRSSVGSLWINFIANADKASDYLNGGTHSLNDFKAWAKTNDFGLETNDETGKVKFKLSKAATFFESLLCYSAFSPIYSENDVERFNSKDAAYSGAYLPKSVSGTRMVLEKNQDYHFADKVTVEKIIYINVANLGVQGSRTLFESGDISGFTINSADTTGWNRYVGKDFEGRNTEDAVFKQTYNVPSARETSTFVFQFNTYNGGIDSGSNKAQYVNASKLLQYKNARAFLATALNRSEFVRYYSGKFDGTNPTSAMLRNTYTSKTVGINNGVDYTTSVEEVAREKFENNSIELDDGKDFLYNNSELLVGKNQADLIADIKQYMAANNLGSKVTLEFLTNPDFNTTMNPYINKMIENFNKISGNPIEIKATAATSSAEYVQKAQKGEFDIYNTGWGPDFADPSTFLATIAIGGDLANYTGTSRFLDNENKLTNAELRSTATDDYIKRLVDYTEAVNLTDTTVTEVTPRFKQFAEQEIKFLYDDFLMMPTYTAALPVNFTISHVVPYSITYISTYGGSNYKLFTTKMSEKLLTAEEIKNVFTDYASNLEKIQADTNGDLKKDDLFWTLGNK